MRIVLDTNVFVVGFVDLAQKNNSPETIILKELLKKEIVLLLSSSLESQITNVILRVKDKNFAGLIRHLLWTDFFIEFIDLDNARTETTFFKDKIPRKDLDIFLTAVIGSADYLVSNDTVFLRKASQCQNNLLCVTPAEFVARILRK